MNIESLVNALLRFVDDFRVRRLDGGPASDQSSWRKPNLPVAPAKYEIPGIVKIFITNKNIQPIESILSVFAKRLIKVIGWLNESDWAGGRVCVCVCVCVGKPIHSHPSRPSLDHIHHPVYQPCIAPKCVYLSTL